MLCGTETVRRGQMRSIDFDQPALPSTCHVRAGRAVGAAPRGADSVVGPEDDAEGPGDVGQALEEFDVHMR